VSPTSSARGEPDPRRWWTLGVVCLALIVISLDNTILNVALPTLERDLGASSSQLQWIVDSYMLVFAGLLLTAGALADRFGRAKALKLGLVVFGAGSGLSALAESADMLIASRALMGVGSAFIMPSTLSILTNVFVVPGERAKAIGIWAAFAGIGIAIGPVTGGWLVEHWNWTAVFLVNLPIVAVVLVAMRSLVPESKDPAAPRLDVAGFALSTVGLVSLVWALIEAPAKGWTDPAILAAFTLAGAVFAAFVWWERRIDHPMLDVALFRNPRFSAASIAISLAFFSLFGLIFFLTQYLQSVLGYTAFEAGLRVMPLAGALVVAGPLSAKLEPLLGTKRIVALGMATVAAGLALLTQTGADEGISVVMLSEVVLGFGMGLTMAPATEAIMGSLPLEKASVGSAVNDATRTAGGTLGVAVLGSLLSSQYRGDMEGVASQLPASAGQAASDSLSGALAVAARLGGGTGDGLADAAREAFVAGMHSAVLVAAAVALVGAAWALLFLPSKAGAEDDAAVPALALEAVPA
jgi:EmrB/QacA subfamily drug resistance transporter